MIFLDHLNPAHYKYLQVIDDNWPFQFLPEFSRFHLNYDLEHINIVYDEGLQAFIPLRFMDLKLFTPAQILYAPMRNAEELNREEQLQFFEKLMRALYFRGNCERMVQPHPYSILAATPAGSKFCEFGTYIVDLANQTPGEIFEKFHPKYQKAVNHSVKHGAIVKSGSRVLPDFFKVYDSTMKRVHMHADSYEYFRMLYNYLGEDRIYCGVVYDQNEPVSGIFLIYTKYSAFLTHAGTHGESKLYGAAKLLIFDAMKNLKAKGVKRFDFVGVRLKNDNPALEGVFRFKKGFGGNLKTGFLWKLDILPMKAKLYDLMVRIRSNGKNVTDIIDQVNI